jgi:hypothetical protein
MTSGAKMALNRSEGGEGPLGLAGCLEPPHRAFALAGGLMRVLGSVVQPLVRAMLDPRQELALGRPVAGELVRDDHARDIPQAFEQLAEEPLGGLWGCKILPGGRGCDLA